MVDRISRDHDVRSKLTLPLQRRLRDRWGVTFLLLAFALAAWKLATLQAPSTFAPLAPLAPPSASSTSSSPLLVSPSPDVTAGSNSASATSLASASAGLMQEEWQKTFVSSAPGAAVHAASLVELKDGALRAVWFSGSREGAADVAIKSAVMDPRTLQWGPEQTIYDRTKLQQGLWRYVKKLGNPVIARAPDGSLFLWMVTVSLGGWAGSSITWARSEDEGASWSPAQRLVTSPFLNISTLVKGAPFFYQNGDMGLPVYHEFVTKFGEILHLDARGSVQDKTRLPGSQTDLQPVVLVSDATHAQVYMRSGHAQAVKMSETQDSGRTWSTSRAIDWPNPDSALAGAVTGQGTQWLALNPGTKNRGVLALIASRQGGSFDGAEPLLVESAANLDARLPPQDYENVLRRQLQASGVAQAEADAYVQSAKRQLCHAQLCSEEFSYPFLLQSRDGALNLVYTWHRSRIRYVRLPRAAASTLLSRHATTR